MRKRWIAAIALVVLGLTVSCGGAGPTPVQTEQYRALEAVAAIHDWLYDLADG